ncbi:MAG: glycosyltransferase family 4 protein [Pyrinomonadaceae bacterium]
MRICYVADGRYVHSHRWMRYFSALGHKLYFLSFQPMEPAHIAAVEETGARYLGELGPFHIKRFWRTLADLTRLKRVLRSERIEVLHCHFLGVNTWYAALSNFHPFVITVMGGDVCGPGWKPQGRREQLLTPFALRQADLITCWSNTMSKVVREFSPASTPLAVIHGGIDTARFCPGARPAYLLERWSLPINAKVIFSPRLMRPLYNLDKIAQAAMIIGAACENAYFVFAYPPDVSNAEYEAKVKMIVARSAVAERVRFVGAIPHAEMPDYYRLADVTVSVPSTDGTPMSVLESMACETPVVVSAIPDYDPEYIEPGKTVLAASAADNEAIAAAICA